MKLHAICPECGRKNIDPEENDQCDNCFSDLRILTGFDKFVFKVKRGIRELRGLRDALIKWVVIGALIRFIFHGIL